MEIVHKLQQSTSSNTCIGTYGGIGTCSGICTCIDVGAWDVDYHLMTDGLVKFRERIYVSYNSELKKVILREFHVKPYSSHPGYHKTLTALKKFYY